VAASLDAVATRLFEWVMAPLVLGGGLRPGRAIGTRAALALGDTSSKFVDPELLTRVRDARVRRARTLVPIDDLGPPTDAEWALAAALHDILQSTNPRLDAALRRGAAQRMAKLAGQTIERVGAPRNVYEAVSRHSWFARMLEIGRTDTTVSWWSESRVFFGVEPPSRLQAWPGLRKVRVTRAVRPMIDLAPLAIDRAVLVDALAQLLGRTPLTELATCTRAAPPFEWGDATLALVATRAGRTLATRALARLPEAEVDAVLGRATRQALDQKPNAAHAALDLLGERAIAAAQRSVLGSAGDSRAADAMFARSLGAAAAVRTLEAGDSPWPQSERRRLLAALRPLAR
jgi:hypothetical protein